MVFFGAAVNCLGQINYTHPGFHNEKHLWPHGYRATRLQATPASNDKEAPHICEILAAPDGSGPLFR